MTKKRVAVLRGGPSTEYDVSMVTGAGAIAALTALGYHVIDIIVTRQGEWLVEGRSKSPDKALATTDVAFIAMHGAYGEDGTVQRICERLHVPFTGSRSFPSSLAFNKDATKRALRDADVLLPKHIKVGQQHESEMTALLRVIADTLGTDLVVKPLAAGSSHGVIMVDDMHTLADVLRENFEAYGECMVEERIRGTEATCGVMEDFRDISHYALPPVEIIPPTHRDFFAADVKYDGSTKELCPGRFSYDVKERISQLALTVHRHLALTQYSRTDCIVRNGDVYFLEVNTLPGLTPESLFPKAAAAVGMDFAALVDHLVRTAKVG